MEQGQTRMHPQKLLLWVAIGSILMMFAAFTSAYVVRRAAGNWYEFTLPNIFFWNTLVIIVSSMTLHGSFTAFKKKQEMPYKWLLAATFVLGWLFVVLQYKGWEAMNAMGATFTVNPSSSFIYLISGVHAAHVLGGMVGLMVAMAHAWKLPFKPTLRRRQRFELVVQYWHFVDALWVYLILFFVSQT